jgi:hypothetical protein
MTNMNIKRIFLPLCCVLIPAIGGFAQQRFDIPVSDGNAEVSMPWTGGYNTPQFSNIDFNRDGIKDLAAASSR